MGFWLSSDQTAADQARLASNFALGFQTGEADRARRDERKAAGERAIAVQQQADAANMAELQYRTQAHLEEKRLILADSLRKTEAERTKDSIDGGLKSVEGLAKRYDMAYDRMLQNPAAYSKESFANVSKARTAALGYLSQAQSAASGIRPGQLFDASPYTNEISGLIVEPEFNQAWLDLQTEKVETQNSIQGKNAALVEKYGRDGTVKTTRTASKYGRSLAELGATEEALRSAIDAFPGGQAGRESEMQKNGKDPFYNLQQSLDAKTRTAQAEATLVYNEALQGKHGDAIRGLTEALIGQGIEPFKPENRNKVGDYFGQIASGFGDNIPDKDEAEEISIFFTGKPIRFWQTRQAAKQVAPAMQSLGFGMAGVPSVK